METYSSLKETLRINVDKHLNDGYASLTHFWQSNGNHLNFKTNGVDYLMNNILDTQVNNPDLLYIPFKYDVPFPPPQKPEFKFIDLFAGIGGIRIALQSLNGKCVFSSEIDKAAKKAYEINFGECPFGDIKQFTNLDRSDEFLDNSIPDHDILTGGFPCQPFSLAGVSARNHLGIAHGFDDQTQGNLFFDIARIIEIKKPQVVFLENVKNFKNHDGGNTFTTVKRVITNLGYDFHYKIINSNRVVPQNRERFYMVCFKGGNKYFNFPQFEGEPLPLKIILENNVPKKYTISDKLWEGHQRRTKKNLDRGTGFTAFTADVNKPANTLVARYGKDGKECLVPQMNENPRKLTPRECARIQGFPENYILPNSDAPAYKQFGNSVAVPVITKIGEEILKALKQK
jgi:DNA (cytosine-5)-methyltransferase 1